MSTGTEEIGDHSDPTSTMDDNQIYTAEYKDGQLQIVEVCPFDKGGEDQNRLIYNQESIVPGITENGEKNTKYLQLFDTGKGLLQLDLLNVTFVKSDDGTYQMVSDSAATDNDDTTITCVLSSDVDDEESDHQDSYVMVHTGEDVDPYMYLQTSHDIPTEQHTESPPASVSKPDKPKPLTPVQILEKAKALQKAKSILGPALVSRRGRKSKTALPTPMELLSSPNFKLYLYSCKLCSFKCNAVKEMSAHKASEHFNSNKGAGPRVTSLQCPRCPYRTHTHTQLMKHARDVHTKEYINTTSVLKLDSEKVEQAAILVCGACGFESGDRAVFKTHIEEQHGATSVVLE